MKKEVTVKAKTTELALEEAAKLLGAPSVEALEYEIVEKEKKGFLGLGRKKEEEDDFIDDEYDELDGTEDDFIE